MRRIRLFVNLNDLLVANEQENAMTYDQIKATNRLKRALDNCRKAGLEGGVYDTTFCLWPIGISPQGNRDDHDFFEVVEKHGKLLSTTMTLDGGAGN